MTSIIKHTEAESRHRHLEKMSSTELLENINSEDALIHGIIRKEIPSIALAVDVITDRLLAGGRLFYIGAGTSGRLGIVDASECPPTFGVDFDLVIGLIAGGDSAIRKAVEFAEDNGMGGWNDLQSHEVSSKDVVVGIAASGTTPYVVGALEHCRLNNIATVCITCNQHTPLAQHADYPIEVITGPEFVTGSTRMKAGTAQKLVLNMLSTSVMIKLGRVRDNRMVDMQLSNEKLLERGSKMIMNALDLDYDKSLALLNEFGSVRKAIDQNKNA